MSIIHLRKKVSTCSYETVDYKLFHSILYHFHHGTGLFSGGSLLGKPNENYKLPLFCISKAF